MAGLLAQRAAVAPAGSLEPDALVKGVRIITPLGGGHEEQLAAAQTRLVLQCLNQCTADSLTAVRLVDDERADLRSRPVTLDRRRDLQVRKAHGAAADVGDEDTIAHDREPFEPSLDRTGLRGVAQLCEQARNSLRVGSLRVPDRQPHGTRL